MTSFVLPHTMARVVGFSVIAAFLKYLTLIPILLLSLVNFIILVLARRRAQGGIDPLSQMLPCILISLCTPFTWNPLKPHERSYLRHSLLTTNLTLLVCLLVIAIVPSETIVTHPAFEHLRFDTLSEEDTGAFLKPNLSRKHNIQILLFQLLNWGWLSPMRCFLPMSFPLSWFSASLWPLRVSAFEIFSCIQSLVQNISNVIRFVLQVFLLSLVIAFQLPSGSFSLPCNVWYEISQDTHYDLHVTDPFSKGWHSLHREDSCAGMNLQDLLHTLTSPHIKTHLNQKILFYFPRKFYIPKMSQVK